VAIAVLTVGEGRLLMNSEATALYLSGHSVTQNEGGLHKIIPGSPFCRGLNFPLVHLLYTVDKKPAAAKRGYSQCVANMSPFLQLTLSMSARYLGLLCASPSHPNVCFYHV